MEFQTTQVLGLTVASEIDLTDQEVTELTGPEAATTVAELSEAAGEAGPMITLIALTNMLFVSAVNTAGGNKGVRIILTPPIPPLNLPYIVLPAA